MSSTEALINLNPVRAGIVKKREEYRWCSLGYHAQTGNRDRFLSTDFGLREFSLKGVKDRLAHYLRFVYEKGELMTGDPNLNEGLDLSHVDRSRYRTQYFTDSGIIGTKESCREFTRILKAILPQNTQSTQSPFKVWTASFPSNGFQKIFYEAGTTTPYR